MSPADGSGPGLVGKPVARPNIRRLIHGKGRYTDDITVPHMLHVAFVRSPYGHARINGIDASMAETSPGVVRIGQRARQRGELVVEAHRAVLDVRVPVEEALRGCVRS